MKDSKNRENAEMFNDIAGSYDFLNHLLSLNIDKIWRKRAIQTIRPLNPKEILDVATGTGDLALAALRLDPARIVGVDVSEGMLRVAREKIHKRGLDSVISFTQAPCEALPFADGSFDAAMVAFGVRNFEDPQQGLNELFRILRPGGMLVVLEFTLPKQKWILNGYRFYFHKVLPMVGKVFSRDLEAYRYLPESVENFPKGEDFLIMLKKAGFSDSSFTSLTSGICGLYSGCKG
jgi:demethylmenaquinone methyltransferase/2-methoxy-6-polyprenyl-1,4-benzoquinol methylase